MAGLVIDPAAINAKLDYILAQLSAINKRLNSHDERIARLEKFQEEKKVRAATTPTAATVAFSHPRLPVQALEGDMAIDAASQASANANLVAASVGANAVQRYVPPHWRDRARTSSPSPTPMTHTLIHSSVVMAYDNNDAALLALSLQPKAVGVDYVDMSKVLTPTADVLHLLHLRLPRPWRGAPQGPRGSCHDPDQGEGRHGQRRRGGAPRPLRHGQHPRATRHGRRRGIRVCQAHRHALQPHHAEPLAMATARGQAVLEGWSSVMASGARPGAHAVL